MGTSFSANHNSPARIIPTRLPIGEEASNYTNAEVTAEVQWVEAAFIAENSKIYLFR